MNSKPDFWFCQYDDVVHGLRQYLLDYRLTGVEIPGLEVYLGIDALITVQPKTTWLIVGTAGTGGGLIFAYTYLPIVFKPSFDIVEKFNMDFKTSRISKSERELRMDYISNYVVRTNKYTTIDRTHLNAILKEIEFSDSDCTDEHIH